MSLDSFATALLEGKSANFPADANTLEFAQSLDAQDDLRHLRDQFIIPTKGSLRRKTLHPTPTDPTTPSDSSEPSIYFVGNSLGAQPKAIRAHLDAHLATWSAIGVNGHFTSFPDSPLAAWQDMAADCATQYVPIVGAASPAEIAVMNTLTTNLHLMLTSFYRPTATRHKIIIEWKPFPTDRYAIQSHLNLHSLPDTSLVEIAPAEGDGGHYLTTESILATLSAHAEETALVLLPGIQYYTGQLLDIPRITSHAHALGIPYIGWDLAHAVGNVPLSLHDWDVDFAVWCSYKYLNAGPGAMAGCFVHERHHAADWTGKRLEGWYGVGKAGRFEMGREFVGEEGAAGWMLGNPSAGDLAGVKAALGVVEGVEGGVGALRRKGVVMTGWLVWLLDGLVEGRKGGRVFEIITPRDPRERGQQLSLLFREGVLEGVAERLVERGVVFDVRKPDVMRVAPAPMYCTFEDVWRFVQILGEALEGV